MIQRQGKKYSEKNWKMRFSIATETRRNVRIYKFETKIYIETLGKSDGLVCVPFDRRRRRQKRVRSRPNQRHDIAKSLSIRVDTVLNSLIANDFQTNRLFWSDLFEEKWLIRLFPSNRETNAMHRYSGNSLQTYTKRVREVFRPGTCYQKFDVEIFEKSRKSKSDVSNIRNW